MLAKLVWYRRSDGVLERQLRDVAGVLKTRGEGLDLAYLRHAAALLGVADLLEEAREAAGLAGDEAQQRPHAVRSAEASRTSDSGSTAFTRTSGSKRSRSGPERRAG